jgi:hypothetical protein
MTARASYAPEKIANYLSLAASGNYEELADTIYQSGVLWGGGGGGSSLSRASFCRPVITPQPKRGSAKKRLAA